LRQLLEQKEYLRWNKYAWHGRQYDNNKYFSN